MADERLLHHLNRARAELNDGEQLADFLDTLANVAILRDSIGNPMLGAKVTVLMDPPTYSYREPAGDEPLPAQIDADTEGVFGYYEYEKDGEEMVFWKEQKNPEDPTPYPVEGIVFEGNVAESAPDMDLWDPNEEAYRRPDDYPMGTVNAVVPANWENGGDAALFSEGYCSETEDATSLVPAGESNSDTAVYVPGWERAQAAHGE